MVETHISVLVFFGDRVYKVRKPVRTPFLDFSTRPLRLADCRREVRLNRRLSPDVYLGVLDVVDEAGAPVDHLVAMRRLPAGRRLATLAVEPDFDEAALVAVARVLADFHARADRSPAIDGAGAVEHLAMLWSTNLAEAAPFAGRYLDGDLLDRIGRQAHAYLDGRHPLFAQRVADGCIVDGHGDLLAEDIFCLDDGPRMLDCIEFDDRFRWGDLLADTAFLAMDLEHLGRADLAGLFMAAYRQSSGEAHPDSLEHWYIAYRALVRAKISCLRAEGGVPGSPDAASSLLSQAGRHLDEAEVHLVLVGGLPGVGKSTVAGGLAERLGWTLLRSDGVRKELAGPAATHPAGSASFEGIYSPAFTAGVYRELLRRAGDALARGESVVVDATWLDPAQRRAARALAARSHCRIEELRCELPLPAAADRIRARSAAGGDASDATVEVLMALAQRAEAPWEQAQVIDTGGPPADCIDRAADIVRRSATGRD